MKPPSLEIIKATLKKLGDPYFAGSAAEVAFWLILSIMPATIVLAQLLKFFTISIDSVQNAMMSSMSPEVYNIVAPLLGYNSRSSVTILLVVIAMIAGSNAVFALMRIINLAYGNTVSSRIPFLQTITERLRAILMTLLMLVAMIFAFYILVYGEFFIETSLVYTNDILDQGYTFSQVWYGVRWIIAFILFFLMVYALYYVLPLSQVRYREHLAGRKLVTVKNLFSAWLKGRRMEYMRAMPGSIFAAVTMLIITWIFTLFVQNVAFGYVNILYGGLASVVLLFIWFYAMGYALIGGILVNAVYLEQSKQEDEEQ